jgi:hypothetical protein
MDKLAPAPMSVTKSGVKMKLFASLDYASMATANDRFVYLPDINALYVC